MKKKFKELIVPKTYSNVLIKDVTFINLNYFEINENYLQQELINIFNLIDLYHEHTKQNDYSTTPFEVFGRFYKKANVKENLGNPSFMLEVIKDFFPPNTISPQ